MARARVVAKAAARGLRAGWWFCRICPWAPVAVFVAICRAKGDLIALASLVLTPLDLLVSAIAYSVVGVFLVLLWNLLLACMWDDRHRPTPARPTRQQWNARATALTAEHERMAAALEAAERRALMLEMEHRMRALDPQPVNVTVLGEIEEEVRTR